ncbi:hypothetical protein M3Y94_00377500 [Aphelenchoides besseyi]|nr:hypothetical protein M3Y94_00377500 [Aphelenchoides besseyi]KAI6235115.1 hypothetical protein M3Y95_00017000 [Aphelenchoides besseyi]
MAPSRLRNKAQVVPPPQNDTVEPAEQQEAAAEGNRVECGYNSAFVGLGDGLNVEPKMMMINPKRTRKCIIYITNISNVRQYFKLYSTYAKNFRIRHHTLLDPGQTLAQEIAFRSFDFEDENDISISIYHSRVKHPNLREKHDKRHIVFIKLLKPTKPVEQSGSPSNSSVAHPQVGVRRRQTEDGKEVVEMNAITPKVHRRTDAEDLKDL